MCYALIPQIPLEGHDRKVQPTEAKDDRFTGRKACTFKEIIFVNLQSGEKWNAGVRTLVHSLWHNH